MQCMRRIGGNLCVGARRLETELREGRVIDTMDDVMRDTRMVWMAQEDLIENRAALFLPCVGLVGWVEIADPD